MSVDDNYTKSLLHFDGANASTTFTDESGKVWTRSGTTTISTSQYKFAPSSGLFAGDGGITTPSHTDFEFGAGDFTIDFWCRATAAGQSAGSPLLMRAASATAWTTQPFGMSLAAGTYNLTFAASSNGSSANLANGVVVGTLTQNVWAHVAVVRSGTNIYCFLNGVVGSTTGVSTTALCASSAILAVGTGVYANCYFPGNIDEFRVSKGVARWAADFSSNLPTQYPYYPTCYLQSRGRSRGSVGSTNAGISTQNIIS